MKRGKLILIMGPTGSGKGTLERHALSIFPDLIIPVSCTTRAPRPGEVDGTHYHFIAREEFERLIGEGYFLEHATYGGNYYGTPKTEILPRLEAGLSLLLEIEVQGIRQVRDIIPKEERIIVYVDAGSWEEVETRVRSRAPITEAELEKRRHRYEDEVSFKPEADVVIDNRDGHLEEAKKAFVDLLQSLLNQG